MTTPFYPQLEERDCGAACLRMVVAHYGLVVDMARLRELTATTDAGTSLAGIAAGAEALGLETLAVELPYDELVVGDLLPCILHWNRDHFVVASAGDHDGIVVLDPASGQRHLGRDDFEAHRFGHGRSRAALILRPREGFGESRGRAGSAAESAAARGSDSHTEEKASAKTSPDATGANRRALSTAPPFAVWASTALYAGSFALASYVVYRSLVLAVDLQFREGYLQELGAMLLTASGLALAYYLVQRECLRHAGTRGSAEVAALSATLARRASDVRQPPRLDLSLQLIEDVDALRVWRAYELSKLYLAGATLLVGIAFALGIDVTMGFILVLGCLVVAAVHVGLGGLATRKVQIAREAQLSQREALVEYVGLAPAVRPLAGPTTLEDRLEQRNRAAGEAFAAITTEIVAQRTGQSFIVLVLGVGWLALGLYRLAYGGIQLGELLALLALGAICLGQFGPAARAIDRWRALLASRLRIRELDAVDPLGSATGAAADLSAPQQLALVWMSPTGQEQVVRFAPTQHLGLVGFDVDSRAALVAGMLGRDNARAAALYFDGDRSRRRHLGELGPVAVLRQDEPLPGGSLARAITLAGPERLDRQRFRAAAAAAGFGDDDIASAEAVVRASDPSFAESGAAERAHLARAIYFEARATVIDGLSDALTPYAEALLMDRAHATAAGRLLVANPRRLNGALGCDLLVHVESGELAAVGTFDELTATGGAFYYQYIAERGNAL